MRIGYLIFAISIPIAGFVVSYNDNLVKQSVILQPQTWVAGVILLLGILAVACSMSQSRKGRKKWK
ncbi:MAG: hypothetical protein LiPW31_53 [Microgenomates group bacterium LiPW_31]|nr:MAG: hypothetical protein LiPW31_53 [Microgenomates group bacterium LiPW_31]